MRIDQKCRKNLTKKIFSSFFRKMKMKVLLVIFASFFTTFLQVTKIWCKYCVVCSRLIVVFLANFMFMLCLAAESVILPLLLHHLDIAAVPLIDIEFIWLLIPVGPAEWLWVDDATAACKLFWLLDDVWSLFDCWPAPGSLSPFWVCISSANSWRRFHNSSRSRSLFFSLKFK